MQKNNCKLKTIFKKGLSFSIALALGAAATSLNLAKTAKADAPDVSAARRVYLAGEKVESIEGATKLMVNDEEITQNPMNHLMTTGDTKLNFGDGESQTNWSSDVNVKVYDWAKIYTGASVKAAHGADHDTAIESIVDSIALSIPNSENANISIVSDLLKEGELQTVTDGKKIDKIDFAANSGKEVQIKVNGVTCKLGTLDVSREVKAVSLAKEPTENCYIEGEKINLSGLALNVTYEDDGKATVEWTEETKDAFTFSSNDVEQDKEISQTINDITVTYEGVTATEKFTLYFCKTLSKEAGNIAKINGVFDKLDVVDAIALSENNDDYKKLKENFSNKDAQVIFAYDIIANYVASIGKMKVALNVGKNYAGQTVTVKHLSNDEIETFVDKVDSDGIVTVSVSSLSPFMVALGATEEDKSAAAETEQKNAEEKAEAAKKEAAAKSASKSVKTGDASIVAFSVFGFIAFVSAAILVFMKKNRKDFEK